MILHQFVVDVRPIENSATGVILIDPVYYAIFQFGLHPSLDLYRYFNEWPIVQK